MKKIFFGISMMLLSALSFTAAAQTQEAKQCNKENCVKEQCEKKGECSKKSECDKKCDKANKCDKAQQCDKAKKCDRKAECTKGAQKACKGDSVCSGGRKQGPKSIDGRNFGDRHHGKQLGHFGGQRGGRDRAFEGIELTDTQKSQIEALESKMAEERKAMRDDSAAKTAEARKEAKKAGEEARKAYKAAIKEILTTEQYTKYEANLEAMKVRQGAKRDMKRVQDDVRKAKVESVKATGAAE